MNSLVLFYCRLREILKFGMTLEQLAAKNARLEKQAKELQAEIDYYTKLIEARDKAIKDWEV